MNTLTSVLLGRVPELQGKGITYLMLRGFVSAASKGVKVTRFSFRVFVWICEKTRQEVFHGFIRWCRRPLATKLCKKIKISKN